MDGKPQKTDFSVKELIQTGKAFRFLGNAITKAYHDEETGDYFVEAVSSSDQEDLVGDVFTEKALGIMKSDFIGKTAFMNHRTNVPDDVFGSIVETDIVSRSGMKLFILKFVVEKENEAAMKTWRYINGGRVQLGTSVTVLVRSQKPNPTRKGGIIIDDIEPIEVSIVGVPCNRESLCMTATASKALELNEATDDMENATETAVSETAVEIEKTAEGTAAAPAVDSVREEPAAVTAEPRETETPEAVEEVTSETAAEEVAAAGDDTVEAESPAAVEVPKALPRTTAIIEKIKQFQALMAMDPSVKIETPTVEVKGLFNDKKEHLSFWDLVDILCEVRWELTWQLGSNPSDEKAAEILALYSEALDEFKAAAVDSFGFWNNLLEGGDEKEAMYSPEAIADAEELEKALAQLVGLSESVADTESAEKMKSIGASIVESAQKMNIPMVPSVDVAIDVTKMKEFQELATRATSLEADKKSLEKTLAETQGDLEKAKAGLALAVEANKALLGQPLTVDSRN